MTATLCSPPQQVVGQKRGRDPLDAILGEEAQKRKKTRLGFPASQWISVYNKHMPMKQR